MLTCIHQLRQLSHTRVFSLPRDGFTGNLNHGNTSVSTLSCLALPLAAIFPTFPHITAHHKLYIRTQILTKSTAFNGGPRICVGQQFALTEIGYTIVRLLQKFEKIENYMGKVDGGKPCLKAEIVLQPGQGVRVGFLESDTEKVERA